MEQEYGVEEVSLLEIMREVKRGMWIIVCLTLIGGFLAAGMVIAFEERLYEATSSMVIGKESAKVFYEDKYTQSDIAMYEKTANTYVEIAKSNTVIDRVAEQFEGYTSADIRKMVTPSSRTGTLVLEFKTIGTERKDVMDITNAYSEAMIEECGRILPVGQLEIVDNAKFPESPIPSKFMLNTVIGLMLGGVASMLFILFRMFKEGSKISTPEQVSKYLGLTVGTVVE
ncbi:MAG: GNVR domain-containing protein [Niameybacter sp.]